MREFHYLCNRCGDHSPLAASAAAAYRLAYGKGWIVTMGGALVYCPHCWELRGRHDVEEKPNDLSLRNCWRDRV